MTDALPMPHAAPLPRPPMPPMEPPPVPERFLDPQTGAVRLDALLAAYLELERSLAQHDSDPLAGQDRDRVLRALGVPEQPDAYCVDCAHGLFESDPEINARLHAAGFTPEQVQIVYDLAAERLVPMIQDLAADVRAEREIERLTAHFGGEEKWREISRQLLAWASKNLPPAAVQGLATSYDGVMALHRMMLGSEPAALRAGDAPTAATEADLHAMMKDPRYWRDRDRGFIDRVSEGFRRMYPEG